MSDSNRPISVIRTDPEVVIQTDTKIYRRPTTWRQLWALKNIITVILAPILLLPLILLTEDKKSHCAYVIVVMGVLWMTEVVPIPATSLLPFFLFPLTGILPAATASATYMNDTSMLFFGGLIVAVAIETWNLHKRIALRVMLFVGAEPKWLLAGMMGVTWFLSMWISNTATTGMMMPIVHGVLQQLKSSSGDVAKEDNDDIETTDKKGEPDSSQKRQLQKTHSHNEADHMRMHKALCLCICYSANIGGIGGLTGTGPNLILKGQADILFEAHNMTSPITFSSFMVVGLPVSIIVIVILWVWMQIYFFRLRGCCSCLQRGDEDAEKQRRVKAAIREDYMKLGPTSFAEKSIMVLFGILVMLWITRDLGSVGGWGDLFQSRYVSDSSPALLVAFLLFVWPAHCPRLFCWRQPHDESGPRIQSILSWKNVHERMPWSVFLILGAGYCIASAVQVSGLSWWLGEKMEVFSDLDPNLMLLILCYIMVFATEVTSNVATATLMMPIMAQMAINLNVHPLFFMFPTALAISFAFMLPVATPPNAIVFSYGNIWVVDMMGCGLVMNILSAPVVVLASATWGKVFFSLDTLPSGFQRALNTTRV